ncbi:hypothetical protein PsYK624_020380 [Phanerochaete sordida]|uniref:Trypsin-like serine protease n=1 Tax=Phanerochaete sordida TaxID=48140 RepID=A0A9P3G0G2_9APHY|nr:hypothetical protein PsYK624_020380 [Phanerochaete sordida]
MALRLALRRAHLQRTLCPPVSRGYATVQPVTIAAQPPKPPAPEKVEVAPPLSAPTALDALILTELRKTPTASLPSLAQQFDDNAGKVLASPLAYESRPSVDRKVSFSENENSVVMLAHAAQDAEHWKVNICSAFAVNAPNEDAAEPGKAVLVTCAHTLQAIRHAPLLASATSSEVPDLKSSVRSGTYVLSQETDKERPTFHSVDNILSSLPRPDLLVLSANSGAGRKMKTLPVSPYPAQPGAAIRAHFVVDTEPDEPGWHPWIGGLWSKWVRGTVLGYRDFAGREATPGTYDALSHLLFEPIPTPGSSGGPIVDEESGAVVGIVLGSRMDNRIEGMRGWGVPAEMIFEMFSLPGLKLKNSP